MAGADGSQISARLISNATSRETALCAVCRVALNARVVVLCTVWRMPRRHPARSQNALLRSAAISQMCRSSCGQPPLTIFMYFPEFSCCMTNCHGYSTVGAVSLSRADALKSGDKATNSCFGTALCFLKSGTLKSRPLMAQTSNCGH